MAVTRTLISALDPRAVRWLRHAIDEHARRHGRLRDLVLGQLARGEDPTRADLGAAWRESSDPLPAAITDYLVTRFVEDTKPRKPGPKAPARSTWETVLIIAFYQHQLHKATQRQQAGVTADPKTRAKARTAKKFGLSKRTLESLIAPRPLRTPPAIVKAFLARVC